MKQTTITSLVAVALLALFAATANAQTNAKPATAKPGAISGDKVKIGVLTDLAGPYSDLSGQGAVEAAKMAVADFGGKVLGMPIEVVAADHQNKADVGASKAREWYDREGVDMITEGTNSGSSLAVAGITAEKKRIFLNVGAGTTRLTNEECNPYTVHYAYDTYALAHGTGSAIVKQGGKTWFFITADYAFGHSLEQDTVAVVKAEGGQVLGAVRHPLNASDFSSYLLQAQASKAQIIGLANAGGDTINAIKAANEFGITRNQSLAGLLVFVTDIHSLGLATAQGMLLTDGWYWDHNDETRKFGRRFFEKMKKMPTMVHAGVYSATTQYLKAVQATGTDNSDAVMAELKRMKINDVFAKNGHIRADGRMMHDMYLMQVKKPAESKYAWDYYTVKAVIPAEQAFQPLSASRCAMVTKK